jgi:hypothetical protein
MDLTFENVFQTHGSFGSIFKMNLSSESISNTDQAWVKRVENEKGSAGAYR